MSSCDRGNLDQDLDTYGSAAAALVQSRSGKLALRIGLHTAAMGAAVSMAPSAEAAPIYSGLRNMTVSVPASGSGFSQSSTFFNLDGAGFLEGGIRVARSFFSTSSPGSTTTYGGTNPGTSFMSSYRVASGGYGYTSSGSGWIVGPGPGPAIRRFAAGSLIGGQPIAFAGPFRAFSNSNGSVSSTGQFPGGGGDDFAGFQFQMGGQTHYAWLRLIVAPDASSITLVDWAYESDPNTFIAAGDFTAAVPEPANSALLGLGLLAMGAKGVRRLRKSRVPAPQA